MPEVTPPAVPDLRTLAAEAILRVDMSADLLDLDDDEQVEYFRPMFGKVSEDGARFVARVTGGGIRSADLKVEFEDESDGSSTADPISPTDTESGQRGRDEPTEESREDAP